MENIPTIQSNPIFQGHAVTSSPQAQPSMAPFSFNPTMSSTSSLADLGEKFGAFVKNPIIQGAGSLIGSLLNNFAEDRRAQIQRQWNEDMVDKQNAFSLDMWNKTNEYNSPFAQKQRLINAGLNPLNYGLDGNSTNAFESAQPLGYDRASNPQGISNPFGAGLNTVLAQKQIEATDAQIAKTKSETDKTTLDNEFAKKTMDARVKSEEMQANLTEQQVKKVIAERGKIAAEVEKLAAETKNEFEKNLLIKAQTFLANANAQEIVALLPYKQALMEAQTANQKAQASAAFYGALYQKKLIDAGYVDKIIREQEAKISVAEGQAAASNARAAMDAWKNSVLSGHAFDYVIDSPEANGLEKGLAGFFNGIFNVAGMITTTVGNIIKF